MIKGTKNAKVIRAMVIGISAMMVASSPLSVLAAEGEGNPSEGGDDKNLTVTPEAGISDQAQEAAAKASESISGEQGAQASTSAVKSEVADKVTPGEAGTVQDANGNDKDLSKDVLDANTKIENNAVAGGSSLEDAKTAVDNADTQLGVAQANDERSDAALKEAADAQKKADAAAADAKDAMQKAEAAVDEKLEDIKNASSISDANAAYDELKETADQAQADFDQKLEEYNTAKNAYDAAASKLKEAEKAYNDAIAQAGSDAEAAADELAKAKANADALANALEAAKGAVDQSAKAAMDIAAKEELTQKDGGLNWRNEDKLFISIMQNYYLPEVLGIKGDTTVVRKQGKDNNSMNYFEVTYTDENGATQKKYYNFLMDDKEKKGDQKDQDNIVIFEKRLEEINWETEQETNPDQYVVKDMVDGKEVTSIISKEDLQKGIDDGSIVSVTDDAGKVTYVKKNDLTDSKTLVSDSEINGTSTEDVTVDKDTTKESWSLDENGNLVKTVTADVTKITYTGKTFISDQDYETEEERDAAALKKRKELAPATSGKDATITKTEKTDYTYTASGTYIPTFTKTVDVKDEEVEWKHTDKLTDKGVKTEAEAVTKVAAEQEKALKKEINANDDLYLISVSSELSVTGQTKETRFDDSDFLVSGKVSATYAKVTKKTVDQSTLGAIWDDIKSLFGKGETANKKLEEAARKAIEDEGGIFVSANWDDWKLGKATIRYVAGVKADTTEEKTNTDDAERTLQDAMLAQAKESGATGIYNVKSNTEEIARTSYSYTIDYLEKTSESKENQTIATETYANAEALTGQIIQNLNYIQGNIKLTQKDENYRKFVDDAKALTTKYADLLQKAQDAQLKAEKAQKDVDALKDEIAKLEKNRNSNLQKLAELEQKLTEAESKKKAAEETLDSILEKLDEAGDELEDAIERLTPPAPAAPAGGGEGTGAGTTEEGGSTPGTADAAPANLIMEQINGADQAAVNAAAQNQGAVLGASRARREEAPQVAGVSRDKQETTNKAVKKAPEKKDIVNIEEEETPLAAVPTKEDQAKMSWWWLLIIALLGATGYEMYKKHQEKKLNLQTESTEESKNAE